MKLLLHYCRYVISIWIACLLVLPIQVNAAQSASALVKTTSNNVINKLKQYPNINQNPSQAYGIIKSDIAPHLDFRGMARSALGRQYWKKATPSQRDRFTTVFGQLVMRTYAVALAQYKNETVRVLPSRARSNASRTLVKTQILNSGPPLAVNYRLVRQQNAWKVYDFDVEGVSMLRSFRSQFQAALSKNPDLNQLIKTVQQQNQGKGKR